MRIADNCFQPKATLIGALAAVFVMFGSYTLSAQAAQAANAPGVLPQETSPPALAISPAESSASNGLSIETAALTPAETLTSPVIVPVKAGIDSTAVPVPAGAKNQGESIRKNVSAMEEKAISNAKGAIKRLDVGSDATTLEDLNSARQTITRIDTMIELERRLKELAKLREESNENQFSMAPGSLAGAIPPGALMEPLLAAPVDEKNLKRFAGSSDPEISQIYGTGGKYTAVVKFPGQEERAVKTGDKVDGNKTVRAITPSSVEIGDKKTSYTLHVKNVGMIHSAMR